MDRVSRGSVTGTSATGRYIDLIQCLPTVSHHDVVSGPSEYM